MELWKHRRREESSISISKNATMNHKLTDYPKTIIHLIQCINSHIFIKFFTFQLMVVLLRAKNHLTKFPIPNVRSPLFMLLARVV